MRLGFYGRVHYKRKVRVHWPQARPVLFVCLLATVFILFVGMIPYIALPLLVIGIVAWAVTHQPPKRGH